MRAESDQPSAHMTELKGLKTTDTIGQLSQKQEGQGKSTKPKVQLSLERWVVVTNAAWVGEG